jgi:hypothetical protein
MVLVAVTVLGVAAVLGALKAAITMTVLLLAFMAAVVGAMTAKTTMR